MTATTTTTNPTEWRNLFGVCACLGEDFGFDPLWLRIALGIALIFQPVAVIAVYFAVGAVVLASRLIAPDRAPRAQAEVVTIGQRSEPQPMALAA